MLFEFFYSLFNSIMASPAIGPQKEALVNGMCHHHQQQQKENGGVNGVAREGDQNGQQQNCVEIKVIQSSKTAEANGNGSSQQQEQPKCLTVNDWDYSDSGPCGPRHWLKIAGCTHLGDCQSPIDLRLSKMRILSLDSQPLCLVNYKKPLTGQLVNNGCSIQFLPDMRVEPPEIYGGKLDQNYRFIQYHFHWAQADNEGSEHTIGGLRYPAELHLVHQGVQDPNKLAVLGIFLKLDDSMENGEERKFVFDRQEMEALKKLVNPDQKVDLDSNHCLATKLPANCCQLEKSGAENFLTPFVRYQGSLTTPPCTENVIWSVFLDPLLITREQLSLLRAIKDCRNKIIQKNYRPVQNLGNREVCLLVANGIGNGTNI